MYPIGSPHLLTVRLETQKNWICYNKRPFWKRT